MHISNRTKIEIALVAGVLLGSCGDNAYRRFTEGDYDRLDVADVNARNAIYRVNDLASRVEQIEMRLNM